MAQLHADTAAARRALEHDRVADARGLGFGGSQIGQQIGAVQHHAHLEPLRDAQGADELVRGIGAGPLEAAVLEKPEPQFDDVDLGGLHRFEIGVDQGRGKVPGIVITAVTKRAVQNLDVGH